LNKMKKLKEKNMCHNCGGKLKKNIKLYGLPCCPKCSIALYSKETGEFVAWATPEPVD